MYKLSWEPAVERVFVLRVGCRGVCGQETITAITVMPPKQKDYDATPVNFPYLMALSTGSSSLLCF